MNSVKDIPPLPCLVITDKLIFGSQAYQQALKAAERQASLQHACHFISTLHLMGIQIEMAQWMRPILASLSAKLSYFLLESS